MGTGAEKLSDISLELNDGPSRMQVELSSETPLSCMFQRRPIFWEIHVASQVVAHFGLSRVDPLPGAVIQAMSTARK
ncbi:MAG: hypothetical protein H7222_15130 [Methylotenera sp.]|nr:hypothetical protein [Oligoflexia bacterium]